MYLVLVKHSQENNETETVGKLDAHPDDERPSSDKWLKSSKHSHSVEITKGTMGSGYVLGRMSGEPCFAE